MDGYYGHGELVCLLVDKPAGMSADNARGWEIVWKMNICPRSEMWNFEDNLSAKDIIIRHTDMPERGLFIL